jgi:hypothetical protein
MGPLDHLPDFSARLFERRRIVRKGIITREIKKGPIGKLGSRFIAKTAFGPSTENAVEHLLAGVQRTFAMETWTP